MTILECGKYMKSFGTKSKRKEQVSEKVPFNYENGISAQPHLNFLSLFFFLFFFSLFYLSCQDVGMSVVIVSLRCLCFHRVVLLLVFIPVVLLPLVIKDCM